MTDDEVKAVAELMRETVRPYQRQTPGEYGAVSNLDWRELPEVHQRPFMMMARAAISKLDEMRGGWIATPCFECGGDLHGPYCPKCNAPPPEQS